MSQDLSVDDLPLCMLCRDSGLQYIPEYPPPYRFCACDAGKARMSVDPGLVEESNRMALKLGIGAAK